MTAVHIEKKDDGIVHVLLIESFSDGTYIPAPVGTFVWLDIAYGLETV